MTDRTTNPIAELTARLQQCKDVQVEATKKSLRAVPTTSDGFEIMLAVEAGGGFAVSFAGWHEHFDTADEALHCCLFGLSPACRLRVVRRLFDHKWTVQAQRDGQWMDDSTTGLLLVPFFLPPKVRYLQNDVLPAAPTSDF
ncbi:MAG TPA: hypothetical protein VJP07_03925 [Dehalococcoidia bacterium]|nr:hypothetical protein [Dehalococcoidia bacterium]